MQVVSSLKQSMQRGGFAAMLCVIGFYSAGAGAQPVCDVEQAQRLFGQQPRPVSEVEPILAACQAAGSTDYRVYMFLGVMARDAGKRQQAIDFLRKAQEMAPQEPNPALELASPWKRMNRARPPRSMSRSWRAILPTGRRC